MNRHITLISALVLALAPGFVSAGVVVIAHPSTTVSTLTTEQVSQIFLGRTRAYSDGSPVTPINMAEGSEARAVFLSRVLGKTEQQLRAHWSRMIFTGKAKAPRWAQTSEELIRTVSDTPGMIGFVDDQKLPPSVKVLYRVD